MPDDMLIHLIIGNYATHKTDKVGAWLAAWPRCNIHFTPTPASWLNLIKRSFQPKPETISAAQKGGDILASVARAARALGKWFQWYFW